VERHGVDDGAVAVKKVGLEGAGGKFEGHSVLCWVGELEGAQLAPGSDGVRFDDISSVSSLAG
jgi:hypothetical protein